jgi:hypothetical protein
VSIVVLSLVGRGKRERDCKHNHYYRCTLAWQGVGSRGEGDGLKG